MRGIKLDIHSEHIKKFDFQNIIFLKHFTKMDYKREYKVFDPDKFTIEDVQYAAGLSDASGCFQIDSSSTKFHIGQVEKGMDTLQYMYDKFGGKITLHKIGNENHQSLFDWTLCGKHAISYTNVIMPYLLIKKREAEVFINYQVGNLANMILATNSTTKENKEFDSKKECLEFFGVKNINNWIITKKYSENELEQLNKKRDTINNQLKKFKKLQHDEIPIDIIPSMPWRAGIFDGKGTFDSNGKSGQRHSIADKYTPLLELFKRLYGGSIYNNKSKNTNTWQVNTEANKMIQDIAEFIIGKKKQVELLFNMKQGEASKIHVALRELKENYTNATPKIDAIKTEDKSDSKMKDLPKGVFYYGKKKDQCIAQIQYNKKVYRLGVFTIGEKETAHELYIKYKEAISAEKRGGQKVNFENLEFTERNKK